MFQDDEPATNLRRNIERIQRQFLKDLQSGVCFRKALMDAYENDFSIESLSMDKHKCCGICVNFCKCLACSLDNGRTSVLCRVWALSYPAHAEISSEESDESPVARTLANFFSFTTPPFGPVMGTVRVEPS